MLKEDLVLHQEENVLQRMKHLPRLWMQKILMEARGMKMFFLSYMVVYKERVVCNKGIILRMCYRLSPVVQRCQLKYISTKSLNSHINFDMSMFF